MFREGGFDIVLGNPPWERLKLQEQEFFASRDEQIANAPNAAARKQLIAKLPESAPALWQEWMAASRRAEGESHLVRDSGRYPFCGKGDVNTYAIFAEHNRCILGPQGRAGFIVPPGLATDDTTKAYFQDLIARNGLIALYEFENEEFLFPGIDHRVRFIVITVARHRTSGEAADLCFANRTVAALTDRPRHFSLTPADFATLNPNTGTCPTFRSQKDADINLAIYRRTGILWREGEKEENPWGLRFMAMLHMANDSHLFRTRKQLESTGNVLDGGRFTGPSGEYLPLVEAKMVHHFDHRFGTYEGQTQAQENQGKLPELDDIAHANPFHVALPRYWVQSAEVQTRLAGIWGRGWLLGWRDITFAHNQRTVIASMLPRVAVGHTTPLLMPAIEPVRTAALYANLCCFALDYCARQKVGGTHLTYGLLKQLPILAPDTYDARAPWNLAVALTEWLLSRVLELTYTSWDLESFARDVSYNGPPFKWDPSRRFLLRCELEAAFFILYGLSQKESEYILGTFPIVRKYEEQQRGEYRTKRVILELYDAMERAAKSGQPYQTPLDPPPADPRVAHPNAPHSRSNR